MNTQYKMRDLNDARGRMEQAIHEGLEFDAVLADLGLEGQLVPIMSGYTSMSFLETLFDELNVDFTNGEIDKTAYYVDLGKTWTEGLIIGLFLNPEGDIEISFPTFVSAMLGSQRVGLTLPTQLRQFGVDPKDATEAAATVGALALPISDDMPEIPAEEVEALLARAWLDGLLVARLARTLSERSDEEEPAIT